MKKKDKASGPDELPVEVWKYMGKMGIEFLTRLFNRLLMGERMPEEWRRSVLIPIYKNKGDAQCCGKYKKIKLMSHTMKVWEIIIEARLRDRVEISKQQYGFMPGKGTTDAMFALRMLMDKYREGQRELDCLFVGLEKAYNRVPREELQYCMRKSGIVEKYVQPVFFLRQFMVTKRPHKFSLRHHKISLFQSMAPLKYWYACSTKKLF